MMMPMIIYQSSLLRRLPHWYPRCRRSLLGSPCWCTSPPLFSLSGDPLPGWTSWTSSSISSLPHVTKNDHHQYCLPNVTKLTLVTDFNVDSQAGWEHGQRTNTRRCVCCNFYNRSLNMENSHHPHPHPRSPHSLNSSQIWRIFTLSTILRRSSLAIVETWVWKSKSAAVARGIHSDRELDFPDVGVGFSRRAFAISHFCRAHTLAFWKTLRDLVRNSKSWRNDPLWALRARHFPTSSPVWANNEVLMQAWIISYHYHPYQHCQHHHPHTANNAISALVQISSPRPLGLWGNCLPPDQPYIKVRYLEKNRKPKMPSDQTHIRVIFFSRKIGNREKMFEWESRGPSGHLDFVFSHTSYVREFAYLSDADIDDTCIIHVYHL